MIDLDFNSKTSGIGLAFAAFSQDVSSDPDFVRYKQQAKDYGVVMPRGRYMLSVMPTTTERLISDYIKTDKI